MNSKSTVNKDICPVWSSADIEVFVEISQVPVHCNILWPTRNEAKNTPKGDIQLGFCKACGHIFNILFEPENMKYSQDYENSLHFSPHFQEYAKSLATRLIDQHDLHNKDIIEIGCGKGEFLTMLCELGQNRGIGFDQSYVPERTCSNGVERITFIQDHYSERYNKYKVDLICCRHVLEHIKSPRNFLITLRKTLCERLETIIFFEVPNVTFTLRDLGIWDIIYEHYSYFSINSLAHLFNSCGFEIRNVTETFEGQFICIEALPVDGFGDSRHHGCWDDLERLARDVAAFADKYRSKAKFWDQELEKIKDARKKVVVWGGGSKGITFLNTLKVQDQIEYVVDINPHKHGKYVPVIGQKIVPPEFLSEYRPDIIIVMNPIYKNEIRQITKKMNVTAKLVAV